MVGEALEEKEKSSRGCSLPVTEKPLLERMTLLLNNNVFQFDSSRNVFMFFYSHKDVSFQIDHLQNTRLSHGSLVCFEHMNDIGYYGKWFIVYLITVCVINLG